MNEAQLVPIVRIYALGSLAQEAVEDIFIIREVDGVTSQVAVHLDPERGPACCRRRRPVSTAIERLAGLGIGAGGGRGRKHKRHFRPALVVELRECGLEPVTLDERRRSCLSDESLSFVPGLEKASEVIDVYLHDQMHHLSLDRELHLSKLIRFVCHQGTSCDHPTILYAMLASADTKSRISVSSNGLEDG